MHEGEWCVWKPGGRTRPASQRAIPDIPPSQWGWLLGMQYFGFDILLISILRHIVAVFWRCGPWMRFQALKSLPQYSPPPCPLPSPPTTPHWPGAAEDVDREADAPAARLAGAEGRHVPHGPRGAHGTGGDIAVPHRKVEEKRFNACETQKNAKKILQQNTLC